MMTALIAVKKKTIIIRKSMIVQVSLVLNNGYCRTVTDVLTVNSVVLPVTGFHGFYPMTYGDIA